eukprot:3912284-Rhodomonas_salina.1
MSRSSEQEDQAAEARMLGCRCSVRRERCVRRRTATEEEQAVTARASRASQEEEDRAVAEGARLRALGVPGVTLGRTKA